MLKNHLRCTAMRALFSAPLFALATGCANAAPAPSSDDEQLPPAVVSLLAQRYSDTPEVRRAAEGFAKLTVAQWRVFARTKTYSPALAERVHNSQTCLAARAKLSGRPMKYEEMKTFLGALTSTPELFAANKESNRVQSGNPISVYPGEQESCAIAKID